MQQQGVKSRACVYYEKTSHKSADCLHMSTLDGRKKTWQRKNFVLTVLGQATEQENVRVKCDVSCVQEAITLQFVMISV